jgi:hypothetical protein
MHMHEQLASSADLHWLCLGCASHLGIATDSGKCAFNYTCALVGGHDFSTNYFDMNQDASGSAPEEDIAIVSRAVILRCLYVIPISRQRM